MGGFIGGVTQGVAQGVEQGRGIKLSWQPNGKLSDEACASH